MFRTYALKNGRSERSAAALKSKFQNLCNGAPTGVGGYSDRQKRAVALFDKINEEMGASKVVDRVDSDDDVFIIEENDKDIQARVEGLTTERSQTTGECAKKRLLSTFRSEQPRKRQRTEPEPHSLDKMVQLMVAREETREKERIHQMKMKEIEFQNEKEQRREEREERNQMMMMMMFGLSKEIRERAHGKRKEEAYEGKGKEETNE